MSAGQWACDPVASDCHHILVLALFDPLSSAYTHYSLITSVSLFAPAKNMYIVLFFLPLFLQ